MATSMYACLNSPRTVPLRPILFMIGSAQHELAAWLTEILEQVLQLFSNNFILDHSHFLKVIQELNVDSASGFMVSFDIVSVITNVPLEETIDICATVLYYGHLSTPQFPENIFKELIHVITEDVEFSFNNVKFSQIKICLC